MRKLLRKDPCFVRSLPVREMGRIVMLHFSRNVLFLILPDLTGRTTVLWPYLCATASYMNCTCEDIPVLRHLKFAPRTIGGMEKIPYLKKLGITAVELMPIHEFDENENDSVNPRTGVHLKNFWGYSTIGFFAPKQSYAADRTPGACVDEFRELVREMHRAGIEVILDVVYNHTAEGNEKGFTFEFRGFENGVYYLLDGKDRQHYSDYSGCGNTLNTNHPVVQDLIIDSLRYWVTQMHIVGFRFDLASVFNVQSRAGSLAVIRS